MGSVDFKYGVLEIIPPHLKGQRKEATGLALPSECVPLYPQTHD